MGTHSLKHQPVRKKRVVPYARVSTEEQTKGLYPSCESQIEELEAYCLSKGWEVVEPIKDEGFSAGSLKRPGLSRLLWLVQTDQIDGVVCTWYDRFTRSRDFYLIDREFKTHNVDFVTLHDRADRATASSRFMEMMLVGAKTYEREQTGEKVRSKLRMRAEKGMWNGGLVPFGFLCDPKSQVMYPDPEKSEIVNHLFGLYVETSSDHAVRDWLKAHRIPAPNGKPIWTTSTIRDLLCNRRYTAEIEVNKQNKGMTHLPDQEAYRIVKAPHEPMVSLELFELAQKIRREKAERYPQHQGKSAGKSKFYSRRKPEHVYTLQGIMTCHACGHPMSPHYVFHKAGYGRKNDSYICHYVCAQYKKYGTDCDHKNRILALKAEDWIIGQIRELIESKKMIERIVERARINTEKVLLPQTDALAHTQAALRTNQQEIDTIVATATSGKAMGALIDLLNQKAHELKVEREGLLAEQRRLSALLEPLSNNFDEHAFRVRLTNFYEVAQAAEPVQLQRLLRLAVRQIKWGLMAITGCCFIACLP